jgi:hypothetical protein
MGIASAVLASRSAKDAARTQAAGADRATEESRRQFDLSRQDQLPWLQTGGQALNQLARLYGLGGGSGGAGQAIDPNTGQPIGIPGASNAPDYSAFYNSPDYMFARDMGEQAIERSAAARGGLLSGNTLAAASRFNSGLATQNFGNYVNRLQSLAGVGQSTAQNLGQLGSEAAGQIGANERYAGDARASGLLGSAAAYRQGESNTIGIIGQFGGFGGGKKYGSGWSGPR